MTRRRGLNWSAAPPRVSRGPPRTHAASSRSRRGLRCAPRHSERSPRQTQRFGEVIHHRGDRVEGVCVSTSPGGVVYAARMIPTLRPNSLARLFVLSVVVFLGVAPPVAAAPEGQVTVAFHVTLAPRWLDPAETESAISPFVVLYGLHDALVKPMPGSATTASLAESWTVSKDGVTYDFT